MRGEKPPYSGCITLLRVRDRNGNPISSASIAQDDFRRYSVDSYGRWLLAVPAHHTSVLRLTTPGYIPMEQRFQCERQREERTEETIALSHK